MTIRQRIQGAWWSLRGWDYRRLWQRATVTIRRLERENRRLLDQVTDLTRLAAWQKNGRASADKNLAMLVSRGPSMDTQVGRALERILRAHGLVGGQRTRVGPATRSGASTMGPADGTNRTKRIDGVTRPPPS